MRTKEEGICSAEGTPAGSEGFCVATEGIFEEMEDSWRDEVEDPTGLEVFQDGGRLTDP